MRARTFRIKTAKALTLILFLSLFQSSATYVADSAPSVITKSVVVRDSSGNLYSGAQVQLAYDDQSGTGIKGIDFSVAVTTNANGEASITAPETVNWLKLIVQPPASDLSQGIATKDLGTDDETINVSLKASNFRAKIVKADGSDAKANAQVYANSMWFTTIRTGAFALALTAQDVAYGGYLGSCPAEDEIRSQGCNEFNIKNVTSGGSSAYKLFETNGTPVTADGSNVFPVKFLQTNVSGTLLNADGTTFVLPDGVGASIHFYALRSDGSKWYELGSGLLRSGEDSWNAALRNWDSQALKLEVVVKFGNSLTLGEASAGYLWMNSAGSLSTTESGTYTSTLNMGLRVTAGTPTLGFVIKDAAGSLINASYYLNQPNTKIGIYASFPASKGNMTLPNGTYNMEVYPASGSKQLSSSYTVSVSNGVPTITDSFGSVVSSTNRVFDLVLKPLNFKFVISDPLTSAGLRLAPNINIRKSVTNAKGTYWDYLDSSWVKLDSQTVGMWIPEGTFKLEISPSITDYYGKKTYDLVRAGNTITVNAAAPTLADSTFKLPLTIANFKYKIVDPNDLTTPLINSWVTVCNNDKPTNGDDSCVGAGVNQEAQGALFLSAGSYSVMIDGGVDNTTKSYKATVNDSGVVAIESETATSGRFTLNPTKPNLTGTIYQSDGTTPITFSDTQTALVEVEYTDNQGNTYRTEGRWLNQWNEKFAFNLTDPGKYRLSVTPKQIGDYANTYSDYIYVNSSRQLSKTLASGYGASLSDYKVALKTGNLPLTINSPIDGQPLKNGYVQIYSKVKQIWQNFELSAIANGKVNANLEANSEAFIYIQPEGNPALTSKDYSLSIDGDGVPTIRDGATTVTKTDQRFILTTNKSNVSGQVVAPDGSQISGIRFKNITLQKSDVFRSQASSSKYYWYDIQGSDVDADGNFGFSVQEPGTYRISAQPYGSIDVALGISETFTITTENLATFSKDLGKVRLTTPLLKLKAKVSGSASFTTGYQISLQSKWKYGSRPFTNSSGISAITIVDPGTYEILLTPPEDSPRTVTAKSYSLIVSSSGGVITNTIAAGTGVSTSGEYTVLEFGTPNLSGQVRSPDSTTALSDIYVVAVDATNFNELSQYSSVTDQDGKWSIGLDKGTYKIYARAPWGSITYTNSEYIGDIVVNETGTITSLPAGTNASNFTVLLTSPTWSGLVKTPDASAVVPYAGVCLSGYSSVFKSQYGWCTNADQQGRWAIKLPSTVTLNQDSELSVYDWQYRSYPDLRVRGKSAIEALIGTSGTNKVLSFPTPNIEITVTAGANPAIDSWVNVYTPMQWYGSAPTKLNGIAGMYSPQISGPLTVSVDMYQQRDVIPDYVSTVKQFTAAEVTAATSAGKFSATIALKQPNFKGIVRDPNTRAAIANTWIEIRNESDNEWVPGASLTSSGTFGVYLKGSCCSATPKEYTITVNAPWDGSSKNVRKQYKALVNSSDVVTLYNKRTNELIGTESLNSTTLFSMSLQEPNLKAIVREPAVGATPGAIASWSYGEYGSVSWAYADVYNVTNNEWSWGNRVEADGTLSMYLPGGCCQSSKEYEVTLRPAWSSLVTSVTKKYKVVVDYRDVPVVTDWRSGTAVSTESLTGTTYMSLSLGAPNVTGAVVNMHDTGTAYSWVTFNRQITNWEEAKAKGYKGCGQDCYFYSGIDGKIATNLEDGNYDVTAHQKWWGEFEGAQSATCALKIETGTIQSGINCLQNDGKIKLKLRSPNLTMTLNDGTGPVRNAWVSIGIGNYWTGARSDDNGYVGIYVDTQTVSSNNSGQSGSRKIRVYVDPPWASTTMARWNCESGDSKPVCSGLSDYTLGSAFSQTNLGTITPAKPNTKITITRPDSGDSAGWYNYVTVYRMNSGNLEWVGWSATNGDGQVAINIETTTATANSKYQVFVEPQWNLRNEFTFKKHDNGGTGYTWAQVNNGTFALGTPNLKLTALLPDAVTANKWGWAGVEIVNDSLTVTSWFTSTGLNEYGKASFTLPSSSKFKVTVNPGPGRSGTSTSCFLQTDGSSIVSKISGECASGDTLTATALNLTLARGNVVGKIQTAAGVGIAGAIIYANIDGAANDDGQVIACSNSAGDYGLILKPGLTYKIKVYPVNKADTTYRDNLDVPVLTIPSSGSTTLNVTLTS